MERRVTAVELRPINLLTTSQVAGATSGEDETLDPGPDSVVSIDAPNQYKAIVDGFFYSTNVTGGKPLVELYFETDPGLEVGKTIRVSGITKLIRGSTAVNFDISKDHKTVAIDTEPYTGRASYGGQRDTPGSTIASTAMFNLSTGLTDSVARRLVVKRRISTVEATTTTAKIVFTSPNYFKVGQIVYVGMPSDSVYYGRDGLFRVKEVGSNFITYDFDSALEEPINVANVTDELYVHAVAQSYIRDGATWFDTSQTPDVAYVWKDYRWVVYGSSDVTDDNINPSPVTNLTAEDENDTPPGSATGQSRITLKWNAPTTNENGTPLVDLIGYTIWYRQTPFQEWDKVDITGLETTWAKSGFQQGEPAYFAVFARDSGLNRSAPVEITHTTGVFAPEVSKPKAPAVTTYLGTIKIAYDDLAESGVIQPATAKSIEVYFSDVPGFTPGPTNFYGTFPAGKGSYIIIPGTELVQNNPEADGTDYYVKIKVRDIYGNVTESSEQRTVRVKLSNIVTFDMIDVGSLTAQSIVGLQIDSHANPSVNGGVSINRDGITAYSKPIPGVKPASETFRLNAGDGSISIGGYLKEADAAGLYLNKQTADKAYASISTAEGLELVKGDLEDLVDEFDILNGDFGDLTAATGIGPGRIVTFKKDQVIKSLNSGTANAANVTEIDGGNIITGTLSANKITTGTLDASKVSVRNINANNIDVGTLSGRTVQTRGSGQRIVIDSDPTDGNRIRVYNSDGAQVGQIVGGAATTSGLRLLYSTGTEVNLFSNSVFLETSNASVSLIGSSVRTSSSFNVNAGIVRFYDWAVAGANTVTQTNGFGVSYGKSLASTSTKTVYAASDGVLTLVPSDQRRKKSIKDLQLSVEFINKLRPVAFRWKQPDMAIFDPKIHYSIDSDDTQNLGLIAQEVKEVLDEYGIEDYSLVAADPAENHRPYLDENDQDPILSVDYIQLVPVLIKAVQELSARIEELERRKE
jgi:hypothetical protein